MNYKLSVQVARDADSEYFTLVQPKNVFTKEDVIAAIEDIAPHMVTRHGDTLTVPELDKGTEWLFPLDTFLSDDEMHSPCLFRLHIKRVTA